MTALPSFASRDWAEPQHDVDAVRVRVRAAEEVYAQAEVTVVESRCGALLADLAERVGAPGAPSFSFEGVARAERYLDVVADEFVRLVVPESAEPGNDVQTGFTLGLGPIESLIVASLERVVLTDPGLLLDNNAASALAHTVAPHADLAPDPADLRILLARHVSLRDHDRVARALALTGHLERTVRLADLTALLNERDLTLEVPAAVDEDRAESLCQAVELAAKDIAGLTGFGSVRKTVWDAPKDLAEVVGGDGANRGIARVLLGSMPISLLRLSDEAPAAAETFSLALRRAVGRTVDLVTVRRCLQGVAEEIPDLVTAVRARLTDEVLAEVFRELASELLLADVTVVLDSLLDPITPDVAALVAHARRPIVEQHLFSVLNRGSSLPVLIFRPEHDQVLVSWDRSTDLVSSPMAVEKLLRAVAAALHTTAWSSRPAAVLVDTPAARTGLRRLLKAQAPDVWILQAGELPAWVNAEVVGEVGFGA